MPPGLRPGSRPWPRYWRPVASPLEPRRPQGTRGGAPSATAVSLTYQCRFPAAPHPVTVGVTARLPAVAKVGKPIQPTGVTLTMALPPAAVSALASLHSATVSAATRLTVSASEGSVGTSVVWPGVTTHPVHRPAHGALTLTTAGTVPSVTASSPGAGRAHRRWPLGHLHRGQGRRPRAGPGDDAGPGSRPAPARRRGRALPVWPRQRQAAGRPAPGAHAPLVVTCVLAPGQHAALGTVLVTGKARRAGPQHAATRGSAPSCPPGGLKLNPRFPTAAPPEAHVQRPFPSQGCAFATGYADVRKLKGAALLAPVLTNVYETINSLANLKTTR